MGAVSLFVKHVSRPVKIKDFVIPLCNWYQNPDRVYELLTWYLKLLNSNSGNPKFKIKYFVLGAHEAKLQNWV